MHCMQCICDTINHYENVSYEMAMVYKTNKLFSQTESRRFEFCRAPYQLQPSRPNRVKRIWKVLLRYLSL
jgi:hypothetical protein